MTDLVLTHKKENELKSLGLSESLLSSIRTFIPLNELPEGYLEFLLRSTRVEYLCKGQSILQIGIPLSSHVYLANGKISVTDMTGNEEKISAKDALFPIMQAYSSRINGVAVTDACVLVMDSDLLDRVLSWSQIADCVLGEICGHRAFDEDVPWIKTVLQSNLFYKVPPVNAERILDRMESLNVSAGEVILRQGEIGNCCYFIKEGTAQVSRISSEKNQHSVLAEVGVGRCFGEDALVYETLRNATVTMLSDGILMRLSKEDFKLLLQEPVVDEISLDECHNLLEKPVVIDVRTEQEYDAGHLNHAANIPLALMSLKKRILHENIPYVLYCDTGRRSRAAAYLLGKRGFNVFALKGGLIAEKAPLPFVNARYYLKNGVAIQE